MILQCRPGYTQSHVLLTYTMAQQPGHPPTHPHGADETASDILTRWLSTRVLENIAAIRSESMLRGQPNAARAVTRRRFPRVNFYGDELLSRGLPGHRHDRIELATVLEGRLHLGIDECLYEARTGDWLLFAPRVLHGECCLPQRVRYRLLWFSFESDRVGCHMTRYTRRDGYELIASMARQRLPRELRMATQRLVTDSDSAESTDAMRRVLVRLVGWCLDALAAQRAPAAAAHPSVAEVARLVHDRLDRPPTVVELANHVGLSPNYLSSLFHQQTGRTLRAFMDTVRIEQAQRMLADPQRSVKQTAYQLGFADPHHFSRVFRRVTGQTPSRYRQQMRKDADT